MIVAASSAWAETYALDKAHSRILFFVPHEGLSMFLGQFNTFDAEIEYEAGAPERSRVRVTIDAESIDMNHRELNERLRGKDFFRTSEFPTITFESSRLERLTARTGKLVGNLTILGVTRPVTLDVTLNYDGAHPFYKIPTLGLSGAGIIDRRDFGLNYRPEYIGDRIELRIEVEAMAKDRIPAAALRK